MSNRRFGNCEVKQHVRLADCEALVRLFADFDAGILFERGDLSYVAADVGSICLSESAHQLQLAVCKNYRRACAPHSAIDSGNRDFYHRVESTLQAVLAVYELRSYTQTPSTSTFCESIITIYYGLSVVRSAETSFRG